MGGTDLLLIERQLTSTEEANVNYIQQIIAEWLTKELNHPTNDACTVLSAQAFKINSCQTAAHKV